MTAGPPSPRRATFLAVALALRAGVNAAFAYWLVTHAPVWTDIFEAASAYAFADGALAFLMAVSIAVHAPRGGSALLLPITMADAVLLVGAGAAIRVWPGLAGFPVTIVMFFGAVGVWAISLGTVAISMSIGAIERDRHAERARRLRDHELFDPIMAAGVMAVLFAVYAFFAGPPADGPSLRRVAAMASGVLAVVFLAASVGVSLRRDEKPEAEGSP